MGRSPVSTARHQAADALVSALQGEIESAGLEFAQRQGGVLAGLARVRGLYSSIMGIYGHGKNLYDMGVAGVEAMTTPRRMTMRVAAAHAFGYWVFQERGVHNPVNPPNPFLVMHRARDQNDTSVGVRIGREGYSTDGGLSSADWNIIWREGALGKLRVLNENMSRMIRSGAAVSELQNRLPSARFSGQSQAQIASQYRAVVLAPRFRRPEVAAGGYFLASLAGVNETEQQSNVSLYRRFPYRG